MIGETAAAHLCGGRLFFSSFLMRELLSSQAQKWTTACAGMTDAVLTSSCYFRPYRARYTAAFLVTSRT